MKKWISIALAALLALALSVSAGAEVKEYIIATSLATGDTLPRAYDWFAEELKNRSGGTLVGTCYHDCQLGAQGDYITSLQLDSIQVAESSTSLLGNIDSKFMIFDIPYVCSSIEGCQAKLDAGLGQLLSDALEEKTGIVIVGWMIRTPRNVYSSTHPIKSIEDFNGMVIRTMDTKPVMTAFELLKATPVFISGTERYMALQTGVVDAAENSSSEILVKKEYEVTKYLSLTEHMIVPNPICVSADWFYSLTEDEQALVREVGYEAGLLGTQYELEGLEETEAALAEAGMEINTLDEETKAAIRAAVEPMYEDYFDQIGEEVWAYFL